MTVEKGRLKLLKQVFKDLHRDCVRFSKHPLATPEFVESLKRCAPGIPPCRPKLNVPGWLLFEALRALMLSQTKTRLRENTEPDKMAEGLVVAWFKFFHPIEESSPIPPYPALAKEMQTGRVLDRLAKQKPDIIRREARGYERLNEKLSALTSRTALNRVDEALKWLLHQLEFVAQEGGWDLDELLSGSPRIGDEIIPILADASEDLLLEYNDFAQEHWQRLPSAFGQNWPGISYILRGIRWSGAGSSDQAMETGESSLNTPAGWVALSGERGSGRTATLMRLARQMATGKDAMRSLGIFLDAPKYLAYDDAYNGAIYEWAAEQVYGRNLASHAKRTAFEELLRLYDQDDRLVWFVDGLDTLPAEAQNRVVRRLRFASNLVFTTDSRLTKKVEGLVERAVSHCELLPLDREDQDQFIADYQAVAVGPFDVALARHAAAREATELAALPLGLLSLCRQITAGVSDCATVTEAFIAELFLRDGLSLPDWNREQAPLPRWQEILLQLVNLLRIERARQDKPATLYEFDEIWTQRWDESVLREEWPRVVNSPILQPGSRPGAWRFVNRQVFGFLAGLAYRPRAQQLYDLSTSDVGLVNCHYLALHGRKR